MLNDEVALEYYRLRKAGTTDLAPEKDQTGQLDPASEAGLRHTKEKKDLLSAIIHVLNERFGTEFDATDRLLSDQIEQDLVANPLLSKQAQQNTLENLKFGFEDNFWQQVLERRDQNEEMFNRFFADKDFGGMVQEVDAQARARDAAAGWEGCLSGTLPRRQYLVEGLYAPVNSFLQFFVPARRVTLTSFQKNVS